MNYITFHYLYRDYSNYKRHNTVTFSNPNNRSLEEIDATIRACLLDEQWFRHNQWDLPDLHFEKTDWEYDHPFHEYNRIEFSVAPQEVKCAIDEFLGHIAQNKPTYL